MKRASVASYERGRRCSLSPCKSQADCVESRAHRIPFSCGVAIELGMTHISGFERSQLLLLPEAIDDYVDADNPVRFIDAFVDGLDLKAAGF